MRLRRRSGADEAGEPQEQQAPTPAGDVAGPSPAEDARAHGPWDAGELPVDEEDQGRAHLGSLSVKGHPQVDVRLQVDEGSGQVAAVLLVAPDGALEVRPYAAPRHESIWDDVRQRLAAEAQRRGGRAEEVEGPYGTALQMLLPAVTPEGQQVAQQSLVLGISGPRWLLRVSAFGRPAATWQPEGSLEAALRDVVVLRGDAPMAPGDPLPLTLPPSARRVAGPADADG